MKILCVAEKNDAAKNIAHQLSNGSAQNHAGPSKYNRLYKFYSMFEGHQADFVMTSVSGHMQNYEFPKQFSNWSSVNPDSLFDAPISKQVTKNMQKVKQNLEQQSRIHAVLIIWTDCDREGENIGAEVVNVCKRVNRNLRVLRARFSEITQTAVRRAIANLVPLNTLVAEAVDARQELDLRIGASFTRLQSLFLQRRFPALSSRLVSFGSCQFPTLGFVVERWRSIQEFQPEKFWKIEVHHTRGGMNTLFTWSRVRLFSQRAVAAIYEEIEESGRAKVTHLESKPKSKWRPFPLETVELEKKGRMLGLTAKEIMAVSEKLYLKGYISYPRTETNIFPKSLDLRPMVEAQQRDDRFAAFATDILQNGLNPRNGKKTDEAHPPIHPLKDGAGLDGPEAKVHEFISRRFLACLSRDATGFETTCKIEVAEEEFTAKGLLISDRGYLEIYPYDKWSDKTLPSYRFNEEFTITNAEFCESSTSAPLYLSEPDLIGLMDKYGIGTDATHADHIATIQSRGYISLTREKRFIPSSLGIGLVTAYEELSIPLANHLLRSGLEKDLVKIENGQKTRTEVLRTQINAYREAYKKTEENLNRFSDVIAESLGDIPRNDQPFELPRNAADSSVAKCPRCQCPMVVKTIPNGSVCVSCTGYPECKTSGFLPRGGRMVSRMHACNCSDGFYKVKWNFESGSVPVHMTGEYEGCLGCDSDLKQVIRISMREGDGAGNNRRGGAPPGPGPAPPRPGPSGYPPAAPQGTQRGQKRKSDHDSGPTGGGESGGLNCGCDKPAKKLTVRKEGPNQNRDFFTCCDFPKVCNFFQWADEVQAVGSGVRNPPKKTNTCTGTNAGPSSSQSGEAQCSCNKEAILLTVRKDGPNQGRQFYKCKDSECNYFQWADETNINQTSNMNSTSSRGRGRGGGAASRGGRGGGTRKPPTCGKCGQSGHTKRGCKN